MRSVLLLGLCALAWGCDQEGPSGGVCAAIAQAGLDIGVTSDRTGLAICDATVTATEGSYVEGLFTTSCRSVGAFERPGTYVLRAERSGFVTTEIGNVRVAMGTGQCPHVETVRLDIPISPGP